MDKIANSVYYKLLSQFQCSMVHWEDYIEGNRTKYMSHQSDPRKKAQKNQIMSNHMHASP